MRFFVVGGGEGDGGGGEGDGGNSLSTHMKDE